MVIVLIAVGAFWGYPAYQKSEVAKRFDAKDFSTHIVRRVDKGLSNDWANKTERIFLLEDGSVVKESQFSDGSGAVTRVDDWLDVIRNPDGTVVGVRRSKFLPQGP